MRPASRLVGLFAYSLISIPAIFAQTNPPAPDAREFVTHDPRMLTKSDDRAEAVALLERARQKSNLRDVTAPYTLRVSFETSGATQLEGKGTLEQLADGEGHQRWAAQVGDWQVTRVATGTHIYSTNPDEPIPLRIQMVRSAVLAPIPENPESYTMRQATVKRDGMTMSCVLESGSIGAYAPPRAWTETEYCVDTATDLLRMWSEAPGIFAIYDYDGATELQGHVLPRQISIFQEGKLIVQIRIDSLDDSHEIDPNLFIPTQEMLDAGDTFALGLPNRFPLRVDPSNAPTSSYFQPVIVHAILDAQDGSVLDAEPIQNYDPALSAAAMDLLSHAAFPPLGFQREVFINVQFHLPASAVNGPPIIHTSVQVHWRILDREVRVAPPRRPRRVAK